MSSLLAVAFGGMLGCLLRFAVGNWTAAQFPARAHLATLAVNLVGCLLIGWLYGVFLLRPVSPALQSGLMAGFLGGLTTFSSFSLDTLRLLQSGALTAAFAYLAASLFGGLLACWAGLCLSKIS